MLRLLAFSAFLLIGTAATSSGAELFGTVHNDRREHRATLETSSGIYVLDFRGADLYHVVERFDRENALVLGTFVYVYGQPVIRVDRITFRPYNQSITYDTRQRSYERRYYTRYPRYRRHGYYTNYP